jgi:hypothetical protein
VVQGNSITNKLIINSDRVYKPIDVIDIEYDTNNYLNISLKTEYKQIALISTVCGLIFLITSMIMYNEMKQGIINKIDNILSYVSFLS